MLGIFFSRSQATSDIYLYNKTRFNSPSDGRKYYSHIYYLLQSTDVSLFHRLKCDEIFHYYAGMLLTHDILVSNF